eukprot:Clim_evm92s150 gene=Clim_evmTU92s150
MNSSPKKLVQLPPRLSRWYHEVCGRSWYEIADSDVNQLEQPSRRLQRSAATASHFQRRSSDEDEDDHAADVDNVVRYDRCYCPLCGDILDDTNDCTSEPNPFRNPIGEGSSLLLCATNGKPQDLTPTSGLLHIGITDGAGAHCWSYDAKGIAADSITEPNSRWQQSVVMPLVFLRDDIGAFINRRDIHDKLFARFAPKPVYDEHRWNCLDFVAECLGQVGYESREEYDRSAVVELIAGEVNGALQYVQTCRDLLVNGAPFVESWEGSCDPLGAYAEWFSEK